MALLACLRSSDEIVVSLTCGALQNLCQDTAWCDCLISTGAKVSVARSSTLTLPRKPRARSSAAPRKPRARPSAVPQPSPCPHSRW